MDTPPSVTSQNPRNLAKIQSHSKVWAFGTGVPDKAFHVEVLRGIPLRSASKKRRAWEHGPGTPFKLLSSCSFAERLERSKKAFQKRRFISKFLRVFLVCFRCKKERMWEHKASTT